MGAGADIARPGLQRENARGRTVATAGGLAPLASVMVAAGLTGLRRRQAWRATALACAGLGFAGLVDDVAGERSGCRRESLAIGIGGSLWPRELGGVAT